MFVPWSGLPKLCFSACVERDIHLDLFSQPDFCLELLELHAAAISQPENKK